MFLYCRSSRTFSCLLGQLCVHVRDVLIFFYYGSYLSFDGSSFLVVLFLFAGFALPCCSSIVQYSCLFARCAQPAPHHQQERYLSDAAYLAPLFHAILTPIIIIVVFTYYYYFT